MLFANTEGVECSQLCAVDRPNCGYGTRHILLASSQGLQLVHRERSGVDVACQSVYREPGRGHQLGVLIALKMSIFRVVIRVVYALQGERVGREERAIDITITMVNLIYLALCRAYAVLQNFIFQHQLAVFGCDMVHLWGVEEVRYRHIE